MLLNLLILVVIVVVAYFHYVQGFFSAFISLIIAMVSAALALGLFESVAGSVAQGKFADSSNAAILCVLFGVTYIVLRVLFDTLVPGNVSFGATPDKIGAGVCGLFAGLFVGGIVAVATQSLPFGPTVGMYSRYASLGTQKTTLGEIPTWARVGRSDITEQLYKKDELQDSRLDPKAASGLWTGADAFALGFLNTVSSGALAGDRRFADEHPAYLDELFTQRLGLQPGAKRTAFPLKGKSQIDVKNIWKSPRNGYPQIDGELPEFRPAGYEAPPTRLTAGEGQVLLTVRVTLGSDAADADRKVRFSIYSFRLCAGGKNYFPVAYLHAGPDGPEAVFRRADDFLIMDPGRPLDLVFSVDPEALLGTGASIDAADAKIAQGGTLTSQLPPFLEFKRLSRVTLAGKDLQPAEAYDADPAALYGPLHRQGWPEAVRAKAKPAPAK